LVDLSTVKTVIYCEDDTIQERIMTTSIYAAEFNSNVTMFTTPLASYTLHSVRRRSRSSMLLQ